MKITRLIKRLETLQKKYGNMDVFYDGNVGPIVVAEVNYAVAAEDDYPEEWNIAVGEKMVILS